MSRRKRIEEEHENHERWLVSYADFITLLFAFFVMMYSISSVNEGKYRVLSDAMVTAFQSSKDDSSIASQSGESKSLIQIGKTPKTLAPIPDKKPVHDVKSQTQTKSPSAIQKELSSSLKKWIDKGDVKIKATNLWVDVEISSGVLFSSGSAVLSDKAREVLQPLSYQLLGSDKPVYVLGYSDNIPIYTQKFSSNWELSAARAVSVVSLFVSLGMDPKYMGAIGFGEHRPLDTNNTAEGRSKNRRVVIRIFTSDDIFLETQQDNY